MMVPKHLCFKKIPYDFDAQPSLGPKGFDCPQVVPCGGEILTFGVT